MSIDPTSPYSAPGRPCVAVIVCTFNGAAYLKAQLESVLAQSWPVAIRVFDDGSSDDTVEQINACLRADIDSLTRRETNLGYVANFERAMAEVVEQGFEYVALCDQDDLWQPERIELGMQALLNVVRTPSDEAAKANKGSSLPLLAHSDLIMIDQHGKTLHESFLNYRGYATSGSRSLPIALGQSGVMGNTILMNAELARLSLPFPNRLPVHDYWLGLIAELFGQRVLLDRSTVQYRIHHSNASNSSDSIRGGWQRLFSATAWRGWLRRDFKLPFLEDERLGAVDSLLSNADPRRQLEPRQRLQLRLFRCYLTQGSNRFGLIVSMLRGGFIRPGLAHRCRFAAVQLITQRYR